MLEFKKFTDFPRGTMYDRKENETEVLLQETIYITKSFCNK